jgi:hypothetical protein
MNEETRGITMGIGGYQLEFFSEVCKKGNIGRVITRNINIVYDTGKFPTIR